jgi:hypothetical protein
VSRGVVDGIDASLLEWREGELQEGEGVVYRPGDPAAHKIVGRTVYNSTEAVSGNPIIALKFVQFDSADDKLVALVAASGGATNTLYSGTVGDTGTLASVRTSLSSSGETLDMTKFFDNAIFCDGNSTPWILQNDGTTIRLGLDPADVTLTVVADTPVGAGLTGTYQYWYTEVDSGEVYNDANDVAQSAFSGTAASVTLAAEAGKWTGPTTAQKVNTSADQVKVYRSKNGGAYPIGWQIALTAFDNSPQLDEETDADLVANAPYATITINGASEGRDREPQTFSSITSFKGSLVGVKGRAYYWSVSGYPHSWPVSYVNYLRPMYGGQARCVREINRVALIFFDNETFRLNYLPNSADSYFDPSVAQERISTYGTPSPNGACLFSPDGTPDILFFASRGGPMITDGNATSRAVKAIDWSTHVSLANLSKCVCVNNPDKYRVEMYYPLATTTSWRCLHFYYDDMRLRQEGRMPKMSWTGPHIVPGPGTYAVLSGAGRMYTGHKNGESTLYYENGTDDAANLVDASGTINFKLRTAKMYPASIGREVTLRRTYISKKSAGTGNYSTTHTAHREESGSTSTTYDISATTAGLTSREFNASGQGHDIRIQRNDDDAMPAINNVTVELTDISGFEKTTRNTV